MNDDTESLVEQASMGSQIAVDRLLERYLPELRGFIRLRAGPMIREREDVSDVAQSVCREVLQNLDRFQYGGEAAFKHWLYTTALRLIKNRARYWRREKRDAAREVRIEAKAPRPDASTRPGLLDCYKTLSTPSRKLMADEQVKNIETAFDGLSEDHREVIVLRRMVGLSYEEIAAKMNRSEESVRALLHRALAALAERMARPSD